MPDLEFGLVPMRSPAGDLEQATEYMSLIIGTVEVGGRD